MIGGIMRTKGSMEVFERSWQAQVEHDWNEICGMQA